MKLQKILLEAGSLAGWLGWAFLWSASITLAELIEDTLLKVLALIAINALFIGVIAIRFWSMVRPHRKRTKRLRSLYRKSEWYMQEGMLWHSCYVMGVASVEVNNDYRMFNLAKAQLQAAGIDLETLPKPHDQKVLDAPQREE